MSHSPLNAAPKPKLTKKEISSLPPAVVLAGGLGTRLRPAYAGGPKSMAPVAGRPFIDYLLNWLRSQGIKDVILCVGHKRTQIRKYVGKGRKWGLRVAYAIERDLLGTGGAVKNAEEFIRGEVLFVLNGDTFLDVNLRDLAEFHRSRRALATVAAVKTADSRRYGSLKINRDGKITAFLEKRRAKTGNDRNNRSRTINGGVYVFEKKLLSKMRSRVPISLENKVFPRLVTRKKMYGFLNDSYFLDIGVPDDFRRAQNELPKRFGISNSR